MQWQRCVFTLPSISQILHDLKNFPDLYNMNSIRNFCGSRYRIRFPPLPPPLPPLTSIFLFLSFPCTPVPSAFAILVPRYGLIRCTRYSPLLPYPVRPALLYPVQPAVAVPGTARFAVPGTARCCRTRYGPLLLYPVQPAVAVPGTARFAVPGTARYCCTRYSPLFYCSF
jgi:hypothetical protein